MHSPSCMNTEDLWGCKTFIIRSYHVNCHHQPKLKQTEIKLPRLSTATNNLGVPDYTLLHAIERAKLHAPTVLKMVPQNNSLPPLKRKFCVPRVPASFPVRRGNTVSVRIA